MERLPPELLEVVFSCLPLHSLLTTCSKVCRHWHAIINHENFLRWRKSYYKLKVKHSDEEEESQHNIMCGEVNEFFSTREMNNYYDEERSKLSAADFIRLYMNEGSKWCLDFLLNRCQTEYENKSHFFLSLEGDTKYQEARAQLASALSSAPSPAMVTTWLLVTSSSVWEVRRVVRALLVSSTAATTRDVSEYLYMVATYLLFFSRQYEVPFTRLHYQVFHALYFLENEWSATPTDATPTASAGAKKASGQQSLMSFGFAKTVPAKVPTAEQQKIIHHPLDPMRKDLIKIVAFAGTGKTTTLVRLTENHPNLKFLLVVYNKSVRIQAEKQFPKANVSCKTVHQMAMAKCGFMFSKKLTSNLKAKDILDSDLLEERGEAEGGVYRRAGQVLAALNAFMNSADPEISLEHVPSVWTVGNTEAALTSLDRQLVLGDTARVWRVMADREDARVRMPHDGYLKLWQLRRPDLQSVAGHDVLLLDEGQDMNPTMLAIFMGQQVTRVIVGDPHQQIYLFRGAVNALDHVTPTHTYFLTQSFRFGPEIAFVANQCLVKLKQSDTRTLVGGKRNDSYLGNDIGGSKGQLAFIGRTNIGLFEKLNKLIFSERCSKRIGLVGGVESYSFEDYLDIYHLMVGKNNLMKKYKNWKSYAQFKAFAKNVADVELMSKIKIVEKFGDRMPAIIEKVTSVCVKDSAKADIVLSTIHKSKGLEFDTVVLLNDFSDLREMFGAGQGRLWPEDEKNLLYVAITRAKTNFVMNSLVKDELLEQDLLRMMTYKVGAGAQCHGEQCAADLSDSLAAGQLMVTREPHSLSGAVYCGAAGLGSLSSVTGHPRQYYCSECSGIIMPSFKKFLGAPSKEKRGVKRKNMDTM